MPEYVMSIKNGIFLREVKPLVSLWVDEKAPRVSFDLTKMHSLKWLM